jgi:UDP-glucose 4-epimerase
VIIVDNLCNSDISVLDKLRAITCSQIDFYPADLCDGADLDQVFKNHKIDAVIHFAALKSVPESVSEPLLYFRNNVDSTIVLLETMLANNVCNLVFSSSCSVYGNPTEETVTELTPQGTAESPYAATKQMCEQIIKMTPRIRSISLRYFNPVGALETLPKCEKSLVSTVCNTKQPLNVFGSDYATHDGTPTRDYVHIMDIAEAHVLALNSLSGKPSGNEIFNLGSGQSHSVLDVIRCFEKVSETKRDYKLTPRRVGDVGKICANNELARTKLGWQPKHSLEDMVLSTWKHSVYHNTVN